MWTTLQPDILSRFPSHVPNGQVNHVGIAVHSVAPASDEWTARLEELDVFRSYGENWDGQGADAISPAIIESAVHLARLLNRQGVAAPSCIVPGVHGTVIFEWQGADGAYLEVEVTAPDRAEGCLIVAGKPPEHWTFQ